MEADGRRERPVEFRKPILPELLHFRQCRAGIRNQRGDVDALTPWRERGEVAHAARQHVYRAVVIQTPQMMERDADLQDALIQMPYRDDLRPATAVRASRAARNTRGD